MNSSNPSRAVPTSRRIVSLAAIATFALALLLPASQAMAASAPSSSHKGSAHKQIILQHHHAKSKGKHAHNNIILQHHHH